MMKERNSLQRNLIIPAVNFFLRLHENIYSDIRESSRKCHVFNKFLFFDFAIVTRCQAFLFPLLPNVQLYRKKSDLFI